MSWIVKGYLENFKDDPTWTEFALREQIKRTIILKFRDIVPIEPGRWPHKWCMGMRLNTTKTLRTMLQQCKNGT